MNPEQKIKAWVLHAALMVSCYTLQMAWSRLMNVIISLQIIETLSKEKMSVLNFQFLGKAQRSVLFEVTI